jgi:hypothetical protein
MRVSEAEQERGYRQTSKGGGKVANARQEKQTSTVQGSSTHENIGKEARAVDLFGVYT